MSEQNLRDALTERFGSPVDLPDNLAENETLAQMAARGSCRWFRPDPVPTDLLRALCAVALAAPSKSDLQQRDIILLQDPAQLAAIKSLLIGQDWIANAPALLVFCANNARQRHMHDWRGREFVNDHLDAFFNASLDAGIALSSFIHAAEAAGLGCCPISTIRNRSAEVSAHLNLPDHVFAVAALAVGYPEFPKPRISMRLPFDTTVHMDRYSDPNLQSQIETYDAARHAHRPMTAQRQPDRFGTASPYTWSDDKTRQYAAPERTDFGAFIKNKGFNLT
ncbi:MAG: nitroreductase family protein [Paracoccaceae bacterium]